MRSIALLMIGYALVFWGSTLLMGGPNNTGSWSFSYTMFGWGTAPKKIVTQSSFSDLGENFTVATM